MSEFGTEEWRRDGLKRETVRRAEEAVNQCADMASPATERTHSITKSLTTPGRQVNRSF